MALCLLLPAALAVSIGYDGGFDPTPQWVFAALAAATFLAAVGAAPARALRLLRSPPTVLLFAIGALSALSAAWTITAPGTALRAGALAAGYGCLALGAAVLARPARDVAWAIAAAAALSALSGLVSVSLHSTALAEHIAGRWQAEGPFGYAPALALVQIAALPVLLAGMTRARLPIAALASACAALAAGVVVLAANRLSVALVVLLLGGAIAAPRRTLGAPRSEVAAAGGLIVLCAVAFHEALGGRVTGPTQGDLERLLFFLLIVGSAVFAWTLFRRWSGGSVRDGRGRTPWYGALAAGVALAAISVVVGVFGVRALGARTAVDESFTHGRVQLYEASYHTMLDRPLRGYGAGSFLAATLERQSGRQRLTRFAHDLPLELGVELGLPGLALALALYLAAAGLLWRVRRSPALWLLGPAVAAFLVSNLLDWTWHLAGAGAVFALALGGLQSARRDSV